MTVPDEPNLLLPSGVLDVERTSVMGDMLARAVMTVRSDRQSVSDLIGHVLTTCRAEEAALILAAAVAMMAKDST